MVSASRDRSPRSAVLRAISLVLTVCLGIAVLAGRSDRTGRAGNEVRTGPTSQTGEISRGPDSSVASTEGGVRKAPIDPQRNQEAASLHGILREISKDRFLSPAGLVYGPGSAEGHRLEHLRRHVEDDPGRAGSHGVFDGGMEGALTTIDGAYQRALSGQRTTTRSDGPRTIYTVDLGKRVGYVGGSEGQRRGNPMARRVRLVLEGNYFVTAFPL
jgi:hypothetical protein